MTHDTDQENQTWWESFSGFEKLDVLEFFTEHSKIEDISKNFKCYYGEHGVLTQGQINTIREFYDYIEAA